MAEPRYGIYRATDTEHITTSFISDVNTAVVIETHEIEKETVNEVVESLREALKIDTPTSLEGFQTVLDKELTPLFVDEAFSAACGLVVNNIIYIVVFGGGAVFIHRNNDIQQIIEGTVNASGEMQPDDVYIFQTQTGKMHISHHAIKEAFTQDLMAAAELLSKNSVEKPGAMCLLVSFQEEKNNEVIVSSSLDEQLHNVETKAIDQNNDQQSEISNNTNHASRSKKITFAAAAVLLLILLWSVVFGVQRRDSEAAQKKIAAATEIITAKLDEATNVAPLNIERATVLIGDAQNELNALKKAVGKNHQKEIEKLTTLVNISSNKIINKQDKAYEVFYDLTLIDKAAVADSLYLSNDTLVALSSKKGEIYQISASKKSNDAIQKKEIQGAQLVGMYEDTIFFLNKDKGIYTIDTEGKIKHPIDKEGLLQPQSMAIFNTNIYVLDSSAGDIYKYVSAEDGYSKKTSYFGSDQSGILKGANDFAIDSSVYVLTDGAIIKYVSGERDTFKLSLPDKSSPNFTHIYTNKDLDKLYLLDVSAGKVVIVSKKGEYDKQIESAIFKKASQFVVFDNKLLVLVGQKIYSVAL